MEREEIPLFFYFFSMKKNNGFRGISLFFAEHFLKILLKIRKAIFLGIL
jgi:hypothetical protein